MSGGGYSQPAVHRRICCDQRAAFQSEARHDIPSECHPCDGGWCTLPPSAHGPACLAFRQLYPITQSRYHQSYLPKLGAAPGRSRQTKPEDTFQLPPAAAPAAEAMSSSRLMVASYAASYCATPQRACNLPQHQMVGDRCWCVARAGKYVNGTAE
jgi:hypothetical protein